MLTVAMYPHFMAEHNKGHHMRVATPMTQRQPVADSLFIHSGFVL